MRDLFMSVVLVGYATFLVGWNTGLRTASEVNSWVPIVTRDSLAGTIMLTGTILLTVGIVGCLYTIYRQSHPTT